MKLVRFQQEGAARWGLATGDTIQPFPGDGLAQAHQVLATMRAPDMPDDASPLPLQHTTLLPPLLPGGTLYCVGFNYKAHVDETGRDLPQFPALFIRTAASVMGHGQAILRPAVSEEFDFEGEVAVVIGTAGRHVPPEHAMRHVAGYTCFNDGSVRDYQKQSVTAGKNFHRSGAAGPWIVTADEVPDPSRITLTTRLNGTVVQQSDTSLLVYPIPEIVSYISRFAQLQPGDIIATGTPSGVGARRTPPLWMKPGDLVEVEVGGVGVLTNNVAAGE